MLLKGKTALITGRNRCFILREAAHPTVILHMTAMSLGSSTQQLRIDVGGRIRAISGCGGSSE